MRKSFLKWFGDVQSRCADIPIRQEHDNIKKNMNAKYLNEGVVKKKKITRVMNSA